jgi:hypothetical protein
MFEKRSTSSVFSMTKLPVAAAALVGMLAFASQPAAAFDLRDLVGDWAIPDTHEVLTIRRNGSWYHPKYGRGRIRAGTDAADITVNYEAMETKCSYRVSIGDGGNTMILGSVDSRQDRDRCPIGRFKAVDR